MVCRVRPSGCVGIVVSGAPAVAGVSSQPVSASCASAAEASSAPFPHTTVSATSSSTRTTSLPSPASTVSGTVAVAAARVSLPSPRPTWALDAAQSTVPGTTTTQARSELVTRSAVSPTRTVAGVAPGSIVT